MPSYRTDRPGVALKSSLETLIGKAREKELADLGFMVLCDCEDTPYAAFFANPSIQKPKEYLNDTPASTNARMSAMLQYILCARGSPIISRPLPATRWAAFARRPPCRRTAVLDPAIRGQ